MWTIERNKAHRESLAAAHGREDITTLLHGWSQGDQSACERLVPLVIDELRVIARRQLARERSGHTLQPTALVGELYLYLLGRRQVTWRNRRQFFGFAAQMMRHILVDHARARQTVKRGENMVTLPLDEAIGTGVAPDEELLALDHALGRLAEVDAELARLVELRFFAGLELDETADALGISTATVSRRWAVARAWLRRELRAGHGS